MEGFPKTSGSRGIHVNVRIVAKWGFDDVRRAALALARAVERRIPDIATSKWWKEERGQRVFLDYNQNARDRTVASAYSVRANRQALVSCPVSWDEVPDVEMATSASRPCRRATPRSAIRARRSTTTRTRSSRCSSSPRATSARGWATRRGPRTSASNRASLGGSRRAGERRAPTTKTRTTAEALLDQPGGIGTGGFGTRPSVVGGVAGRRHRVRDACAHLGERGRRPRRLSRPEREHPSDATGVRLVRDDAVARVAHEERTTSRPCHADRCRRPDVGRRNLEVVAFGRGRRRQRRARSHRFRRPARHR